ncbi:hypothetical protein FB45DRAFT_1106349 [Roridomyces roridus]|uniref:Uncharacterized protein n=1 Tax=Roridomyces roridus TaxID=1738132 RepID=A0AAD7F7T7_9AGAR|nr:hypothetical protein FB45DRAFT_1106349 [Roridomyces roridus]
MQILETAAVKKHEPQFVFRHGTARAIVITEFGGTQHETRGVDHLSRQHRTMLMSLRRGISKGDKASLIEIHLVCMENVQHRKFGQILQEHPHHKAPRRSGPVAQGHNTTEHTAQYLPFLMNAPQANLLDAQVIWGEVKVLEYQGIKIRQCEDDKKKTTQKLRRRSGVGEQPKVLPTSRVVAQQPDVDLGRVPELDGPTRLEPRVDVTRKIILVHPQVQAGCGGNPWVQSDSTWGLGGGGDRRPVNARLTGEREMGPLEMDEVETGEARCTRSVSATLVGGRAFKACLVSQDVAVLTSSPLKSLMALPCLSSPHNSRRCRLVGDLEPWRGLAKRTSRTCTRDSSSPKIWLQTTSARIPGNPSVPSLPALLFRHCPWFVIVQFEWRGILRQAGACDGPFTTSKAGTHRQRASNSLALHFEAISLKSPPLTSPGRQLAAIVRTIELITLAGRFVCAAGWPVSVALLGEHWCGQAARGAQRAESFSTRAQNCGIREGGAQSRWTLSTPTSSLETIGTAGTTVRCQARWRRECEARTRWMPSLTGMVSIGLCGDIEQGCGGVEYRDVENIGVDAAHGDVECEDIKHGCMGVFEDDGIEDGALAVGGVGVHRLCSIHKHPLILRWSTKPAVREEIMLAGAADQAAPVCVCTLTKCAVEQGFFRPLASLTRRRRISRGCTGSCLNYYPLWQVLAPPFSPFGASKIYWCEVQQPVAPVGDHAEEEHVPDPRLTGIPDKDDRTQNDRNSGTKDSGEGRKVGGGRWSPTGDTTKTQGDQVPYASSKGSNPDETRKDKRRARKRARGRARSSQGRIDQEHEYEESDKVKNSDPGVEVDTPEKPEKPEGAMRGYLHRSKVEWVKDGMKLRKGESPNKDRSPVKIDPGLLEPEPELGQN